MERRSVLDKLRHFSIFACILFSLVVISIFYHFLAKNTMGHFRMVHRSERSCNHDQGRFVVCSSRYYFYFSLVPSFNYDV